MNISKYKNILRQERFAKLNKAIYTIPGILFIIGGIYYKEKVAIIMGACLIIVGFSSYKSIFSPKNSKSGKEKMEEMADIFAKEEAAYQNSLNNPEEGDTETSASDDANADASDTSADADGDTPDDANNDEN